MNVSLETPRLILREISTNKDDLTAYLGWLRDTQNNSFIQSAKIDYGLEELVDFIEAINSDANAILLGIFLAEEYKFIGTLKVQPIDYREGTAWLGIMIGSPESRGLGYGREALEGVLSYLFNSLQIREVFLGVNLENKLAISLYTSLGFSDYKTEINSMVMRKTNIT